LHLLALWQADWKTVFEWTLIASKSMSQALYRKWRPHLWDEVVGQEHVVHTLQNAIRTGRVGHAYLFSGPRGTGKTTSARLLAKAVNCLEEDITQRPCDHCAHCISVNEGSFMDLIEIDAASNTSVDDIRQLRETINFSPSQGRFKVYIIDEVHMLSTAAFNALLKTLEEPPPHAIFILATTEVHKIPATVLSRCQRHEFRRIPVQVITALLRSMCQKEDIPFDEDALVLIARQSTGSMRDAISLLDQLASTGARITLATAQEVLGTATSQAVVTLIDAVLNRDAAAGLECIHQALDNGTDPRQFARQVVEYLRGVLLTHLGNPDQVDVTSELRQQITAQARRFELPALLECLRLFNTAASEVRGGWQPGLLLELAVAESVAPKAAPAPSQTTQAPSPVQRSNPAPTSTALPTRLTPPAELPPQAPADNAAHQPAKENKPAAAPTQKTVSTPPAPVQPVAASVAAHPASEEPGSHKVDMNTIQQNWPRIKQSAKEMKVNIAGLLNSCTLVAIKDGVLLIGFSSDLLKQKMEAGDNLQLAHRAIHKVTGLDIPVKCVVIGAKGNVSGPDPDIEGDGIVGTALNMGGQIVHKKKTE
jgi:DNA polymerase-3 subunit gamma/tau